jgi:hypothetical protein
MTPAHNRNGAACWRLSPTDRPAWRIRATVCAAIVASAIGLAACSSVRNELGTSSSNCYVALPAAAGAVDHEGHLYGVRLVTVASLRHRAPNLYRAASGAPPPKVSRVCLVAFSGHFRASTVHDPVGQRAGFLAVVELGYPGNRLLATWVAPHQALVFGHSHISGP